MASLDTQTADIEPELLGRTPRRVRYTFGTQAARLLLLLLLIAGGTTVTGLGTRDLNDLTALRTRGVSASARITDKRESHGKSTTYRLDYEFTGNGVEVDSDEDVSSSEYEDANIGDAIPVTYLPEHPETHRIGSVDDARVASHRTGWIWGWIAALGILGLAFGATEAGYRNRRRLLEEGQPVRGTVTDRKKVQGKSITYYVTYRYPGPRGEQQKKIQVSEAFYHQALPDTSLTVLYDPARPENSRPYRAFTDMALD